MGFIFTKMHSLGNDFVILESDHPEYFEKHIADIAHRKYGIGCDQVLCVTKKPPYKLFIWNQDGSIAAACGNGTRCVVAYLAQKTEKMKIELDGPIGPLSGKVCSDKKVTVKQGKPKIGYWREEKIKDITLEKYGLNCGIFVDMGNPHLVVNVSKGVERSRNFFEKTGRDIEEIFHDLGGINVSFVEEISVSQARATIWERGVGLTSACGSAACAIAAIMMRCSSFIGTIMLHMPGGTIEIYKDTQGNFFHTADASTIFTGKWMRT